MTTLLQPSPTFVSPTVRVKLEIHTLAGVKLKQSIDRLSNLVAREGSTMHEAYLAIAQRRRTYAVAAIAVVRARPFGRGLDIGSALITEGDINLMVWVDVHVRRQGVGTKLVRAALDRWRGLYGHLGRPAPIVWRGAESARNFWVTFGDAVR